MILIEIFQGFSWIADVVLPGVRHPTYRLLPNQWGFLASIWTLKANVESIPTGLLCAGIICRMKFANLLMHRLWSSG